MHYIYINATMLHKQKHNYNKKKRPDFESLDMITSVHLFFFSCFFLSLGPSPTQYKRRVVDETEGDLMGDG